MVLNRDESVNPFVYRISLYCLLVNKKKHREVKCVAAAGAAVHIVHYACLRSCVATCARRFNRHL